MMTSRRITQAAILAILAAVPFASPLAQCAPGGPPNPAATPRALVGTVMDTAHRVIEGATVFIRNPQRQVRTDRSGRFRIDSLPAGTYEVTVRRIGHEIAIQPYVVTDSGGVARFCLVPETRGLPAMITSARRAGLGGVVGDSTYTPMAGAEVRAIAEGQHAVTDSAGGFHLPLKPGTYAVVVSKPGFERQLLSITVPPDSGREIAVWLGPPARDANRMNAALDEMRTRMLISVANRTAVISSEDLAKTPVDLLRAAQMRARTSGLDSCDVIVDGKPHEIPLSAFDKDEILMMEIYVFKPPRATVGSIDSRGTGGGGSVAMSAATPPGQCPGKVYIWLKR